MRVVLRCLLKGGYRFDINEFYYCSHIHHYCVFEKDWGTGAIVYVCEKNDLFMGRRDYHLFQEGS